MPDFRRRALLTLPLLCGAAWAQNSQYISGAFGSPETFATHTQLVSYGFAYGPSDGTFGAIPAGGNTYTFYGTAGSNATCAGSPNNNGVYSFTGTLDQVTGSVCKRMFGPGSGPAGWVFDQNYAGGGQIVPFSSGANSGWLVVFHGEYQWKNPDTASGACTISGAGQVPCFYSSLGLAVSMDNGKSFQVAGQILQPSQPLSAFEGGGTNMAVGYGSLIVADANGKHLDNPPADPRAAYFYLFYSDLLPGLPGACAANVCIGVARAPYASVVAAALSGDPHQVATLFQKYNGATPNPWAQPATSDTPDLSGTAGSYAPLWTNDGGASPEVIYDSSYDVYLAVYLTGQGLRVRASSDLIHWTGPIGASFAESGRSLYYPTFIGDTGDPTIGGPVPRIYFSSFANGSFPNYGMSIFESVPLNLSLTTGSPFVYVGRASSASGGNGSVNVTVPAGFSWTATTTASWITFSGPASGVGSGTLSYQVAPNSGGIAPPRSLLRATLLRSSRKGRRLRDWQRSARWGR